MAKNIVEVEVRKDTSFSDNAEDRGCGGIRNGSGDQPDLMLVLKNSANVPGAGPGQQILDDEALTFGESMWMLFSEMGEEWVVEHSVDGSSVSAYKQLY